MKPIHFYNVIFLFLIFYSFSFCQETVTCGTVQPENTQKGYSKTVGGEFSTGISELAIVLVDFPEGRIQPGNILPVSDSDLNYFGNDHIKLNSIGSMGYVRDPKNPNNLIRKIRKYTYDDYWDWVFSESPIWTGKRHPDYDVAGAEVTTYGSLKDYFKEVSYNHLIITPVQTWVGPNDKYHTGIINPTDVANGKRYVHWIMMPNAKRTYYNSTLDPPKYGPLEEIKPVLRDLKASGTIEFDVDSYLSKGGKILIIVAGGARSNCAEQGIPGHDGQLMSVAEKRFLNYEDNSTLSGIAPMVHEFGHTLGFKHLASETYDPMNFTYYDDWTDFMFCPPHFNPIFKLQKGWLTLDDVEKVSSTKDIALTPITSVNKKIALLTLYGDAGRDGDYNHSEYFALEYRTRDGFNRFSGGVDSKGFSGGVLIWHYSKYGTYYFNNAFESSPIGLKIANYADTTNYTYSYYHSQNPDDFYYSGHSLIDQNSNPNTSSILRLPTGISLSDFSVSNNMINIDIDYTLGAVPTYSEFYPIDPSQGKIVGNAYIEDNPSLTNLIINNNSKIDFAPGSDITVKYLLAIASSPKGIILQGAGFGSSRAPWDGIYLQNNDLQQSEVKQCMISNVSCYSNSVAIHIDITDSGIEPVISNNYFQNNANDLYFYNTGNLFRKLRASGNKLSINSKMKILGNWDITNTFIIPSGNELKIESFLDDNIPSLDNIPTTIQFEPGTSLYCYGKLTTSGTSNYNVNFTCIDSSHNWGSIIFNGSGANGSVLNYVNMQHSNGIQVINNAADITIQNSTFKNNIANIIFTGSSGSVSNNTITGGHNGIVIRNSSNVKCNLNKIVNCNCGIICSGASSGYIGGNDIDYCGIIGIYIADNSDPLFKNTPDALSRNNRITHCLRGLGIYNSYPIMYNLANCNGLNSIYANDSVDLGYFNDSNSILNAENNYWYGGDTANAFFQGKKHLIVSPFCLNDPWEGVPLRKNNQNLFSPSNFLSKSNSLKISAENKNNQEQIDSLQDGIQLREDGKFNEAKNFFINYLNKHPDLLRAYVELYNCYCPETGNDISRYFEQLPQSAPMESKLLLAYLYLKQGNVKSAEETNNKIINERSSTSLSISAELNNFYITLYIENNLKEATNILEGVTKQTEFNKDNFTIPIEISLASEAINDYVLSPLGSETLTSTENIINEISDNKISKDKLIGNYPNPFNPSTLIRYELVTQEYIILKVYNILGEEVATLVNNVQEPGVYSVSFNGSNYASGVYLYQLSTNGSTQMKKMLMIK